MSNEVRDLVCRYGMRLLWHDLNWWYYVRFGVCLDYWGA